MSKTAPPRAIWRSLLLAATLLALQLGCERIDPVTADPASSAEAITLTCESCHTSQNYLRLLAVEEAASESAGGG